MDVLTLFGERLEEIIFEKNLTPAMLADVLNVSVSAIYRYKEKKMLPTISNAIKLAEYFGCSLSYLFGLTDDPSFSKAAVQSDFYTRYRNLLNEKQVTRYRVKKDNKFSRQSVDDWFHCKHIPTADNLVRMAVYFDVSVDYMVGREN